MVPDYRGLFAAVILAWIVLALTAAAVTSGVLHVALRRRAGGPRLAWRLLPVFAALWAAAVYAAVVQPWRYFPAPVTDGPAVNEAPAVVPARPEEPT